MALSTRQRRQQPSDSASPSSPSYTKHDKPERSVGGEAADRGLAWTLPLFALGMLRSQFALRSYMYLIFHKVVGGPASWVFSEEKVRVFYAVRIFLGLLSVITETALVVALSRRYGKRLASYALAMMCLTSGCFFASTSA
ncbi:alg9-like mannosyltransferase family [Actinidia rufa]|uniref:Alg9-like mannosyltransferase family n=1 Tax=Actinidia rufa TaxID=165716 RepID=A0A7J0G2W7_9ERIC|nr:alg9-like mannosyltransferase family [Actinidia rufa]